MKIVVVAMLAALLGGGLTPSEWAPREFPVSFWCGPPADKIGVESFKQIAAAGFDYTFPACEGPFTPAVNRRVLDVAKAAGIKAFLFDDRQPLRITGEKDATKRLDAIVADYAKHPAFAGYFLTDEPSADKFAGLGEVVAYLRQKDPAHPAYINLFPNYANAEQLGTATYEEHVGRFIRQVQPAIVSYDHYHFLKGSDRPGFFANLESVRAATYEAKLPFWQIVLALPHLGYRQPTEAEKRFEAFQTLVYGGKGLMYFTYWTPPGQDFAGGEGIIKRDGTPGPQYEEVKRVNADVRLIGKYLLNAVQVTVFQNGNIATGGHPREQGTPVSFPGGGDVTTGLFLADTHLYALFANRDYKARTACDVLLGSANKPIEHLVKATGKWEPVKGQRNVDNDLAAKLDLAPGDAELYRW